MSEKCQHATSNVQVAQKKKPPEGGPYKVMGPGLCDVECRLAVVPINHEADASEAEDHHCPRGEFGNGTAYTGYYLYIQCDTTKHYLTAI